jgi:hypothetical protein
LSKWLKFQKIPPEGQKKTVIQEGTCGKLKQMFFKPTGFLLKDKKP